MKREKYSEPLLRLLNVKTESGFLASSEGFERDDQTDAGWE
ncbi:MAG: hypothetical protein ACI35T_00365 [Alistipes sp.]